MIYFQQANITERITNPRAVLMNIELKEAQLTDVDEVLALHNKYHVSTLTHQDKSDGFITTPFTKDNLIGLVEKENGLFIACVDGNIVAYVMAASWAFCSQWPMLEYMVNNLADAKHGEQTITPDNSYQYGPVCVDKSVRGSGIFEKLFHYSLEVMSKRYPYMVTFINKANLRSFQAHTQKTPLVVINDFEFNNNQYYKLACQTAA